MHHNLCQNTCKIKYSFLWNGATEAGLGWRCGACCHWVLWAGLGVSVVEPHKSSHEALEKDLGTEQGQGRGLKGNLRESTASGLKWPVSGGKKQFCALASWSYGHLCVYCSWAIPIFRADLWAFPLGLGLQVDNKTADLIELTVVHSCWWHQRGNTGTSEYGRLWWVREGNLWHGWSQLCGSHWVGGPGFCGQGGQSSPLREWHSVWGDVISGPCGHWCYLALPLACFAWLGQILASGSTVLRWKVYLLCIFGCSGGGDQGPFIPLKVQAEQRELAGFNEGRGLTNSAFVLLFLLFCKGSEGAFKGGEGYGAV